MTYYTVHLLDVDGNEITTCDRDTRSDAKDMARYYLSDRYADYVGAKHADWQTSKAEVRKHSTNGGGGDCVWDAPYRGK